MKRKNPIALLVGWLALSLGPSSTVANAQAQSTGTIEGRVLNVTNGLYLNNARVTIKGTALETLTNESGEYRFTRVPPGSATVTALYTGLDERSVPVTVTAGGVVRQDIELNRAAAGTTGDPVTLDKFVVAVNRDFNAQAIAINEQRFASNIKSVVSADEFGDIAEGNIGDFLKYVPGVYVDYSAGSRATSIAVRGFPANATAMTMDGDQISDTGGNRSFNLEGFQALNNVARIEVVKSPTPDLPASMLGGRVNLISKSAFERSKPVFNYRVAGTYNTNLPSLGKHPSYAGEEMIRTVRPSVDFGYIVPLSKTLGFTVSAAHNSRLVTVDNAEGSWDQVRLVMTTFEAQNSIQTRETTSASVTGDWKFAENDTLSGTLSYVEYMVLAPRRTFRAGLGANPIGDATFAESATATSGTATMVAAHVVDRRLKTWHGALKYRHTGPVWRVDASSFYSSSTIHERQGDKDAFATFNAVLPSVRIRYDGIGQGEHPGPARISATTPTGPVDFWDVNNYQLRTIADTRSSRLTKITGGRLDAKRFVDFRVPVELKTGLYFNRLMRESRNGPKAYTFLGPDGIANNADNLVGRYDWIAHEVSKVPMPYGFPVAQTLSMHKVFDYYKANPGQFTFNEAASISGAILDTDRFYETISAAYVRGDVKLMNNRLMLVGGIRFERTENEGWGGLDDINATFVKNADGTLARTPTGATIPITTDPIAVARLRYKEYGAYSKRTYSDWYPSLNASFSFTESMIGRVAYARTIGRPNFTLIVPGTTISSPAAPDPTITVNNPGLLPWTADGLDLSLEKYFASNGVLSVGVYRKEIDNFFGATTTPATPELLASYSLPEDLVGYDLNTQHNVTDTVKISGLEFNYRQALGFLPAWARGIQVFVNGTFNKLDGSRDSDFNGFAKRIYNYGISYNRPRLLVKLNWTDQDWVRGAAQAEGPTIRPGSYFWNSPRRQLDGNFEIRLSRQLSFFGTASNLMNKVYRRERRAPDTPKYAENNRFLIIGVSASVGIKGEF